MRGKTRLSGVITGTADMQMRTATSEEMASRLLCCALLRFAGLSLVMNHDIIIYDRCRLDQFQPSATKVSRTSAGRG
jgi:hypothetical protein